MQSDRKHICISSKHKRNQSNDAKLNAAVPREARYDSHGDRKK